MDTSPFALRLELLKLAQTILERDCDATQERLRMNWDNLTREGNVVAPFPELPTPTTEQVVAEAKKLYAFVTTK